MAASGPGNALPSDSYEPIDAANVGRRSTDQTEADPLYVHMGDPIEPFDAQEPQYTDVNAHIKALQEKLNGLGAKLLVDGVLGPKTQAAMRQYGLDLNGNAIPPAPAAPAGGRGSGKSAGPPPSPAATGQPAAASIAAPASHLNAQQVDQYVRDHYPQMAWALNDPELGPLLRSTADPTSTMYGADPSKFQGALEQTNWWKDHGVSARQWAQLQAEDPAEAARRLQARAVDIRIESQRVGLTLDDATINAMAGDALTFAWSDNELRQNMAGRFTITPGQTPGGDIGAEMTKLRATAEGDYMVDVGDPGLADWAKRIYTGQADEAGFTAYLTQQAKGKFPGLGQYIDQGITPKSFFDPYKQQAAKLLEIPPDQVDLMNNPQYMRMTSTSDPNGQLRPMTLYEAGQYVRGLDAYKNTNQGKQQAAQLGDFIDQKFGKVAA